MEARSGRVLSHGRLSIRVRRISLTFCSVWHIVGSVLESIQFLIPVEGNFEDTDTPSYW